MLKIDVETKERAGLLQDTTFREAKKEATTPHGPATWLASSLRLGCRAERRRFADPGAGRRGVPPGPAQPANPVETLSDALATPTARGSKIFFGASRRRASRERASRAIGVKSE